MEKNKDSSVILDAEEKDILESFERGEWKSVQDVEKRKAILQRAASNFMKKNNHENN